MAATAPVKEIGYANESYNWWLYDGETTPELIWPQSVFVYDAMRRTDSQVRSVLQATTLPVRRTPWRLDPAGARDEVVELIADDLGLPIVGQQPKPQPRTKDRFSWADHLRQALLMLPFGFMFFEQVYRIDPDGSRAHLRKLAPRMPRTIQRIDVAPDGGLIQISQYSSIAQTYPGQTQRSLLQEPIPVDRLVGYVYELEGGNWIGHSVLRSCYKNWLIKDRLLRVQAQTIERNGMGVPLYKAQDGASETDMIAGKAMAMAWRAGEAAGSAVPFGADVVLRGVEGTLPDADPAIRYHDEQIARGVLAHFLNLGTQTGSWALGSTFADFFTMSLQTLAQQIADTFTQHVIEDLVDLNFGESEPAPKLVFDEIGSRQSATADALKALIDAGAVIPDRNTEENLRQMYGLPPKEEGAPSPTGPTAPGASGPPVTPEPGPGPSPEPPTTAPEYAIPAPGLQAGAGHPKGEAAGAVAARFNPDEPRGFHGRWSGGGGSLKDALKLGGRIHLNPGERLVSSSRFKDTSGHDVDLLFAVIHGEHFNEVRIGVIPSHDVGKWTAEAKGATAGLDNSELRQARADLAAAAAGADKAAAEAEKAWGSGRAPTDPKLLGSEPVASGTFVSPNHDDLDWKIYLNDQGAWDLSIAPARGDFDGISLDPSDTEALLKHLDGIQNVVGPG